jgi:outer membrane protein assembly factor BamB
MSGVAALARLPEKWSTTEGVAWATPIPGNGWSSPIVWNGMVFITSAIGAKAFKQPSPGIFGNDYVSELRKQGLSMEEAVKRVHARDSESGEESGELRYMLYALDAKTGKVKWEAEAHRGQPAGRHRKNTFASETPFTDGKHIYAYFGQNVGMFCFDKKGKLRWKKQWTPKAIYQNFGTASSPAVHEGRIYLIHDNEEESALVALDTKTGNEVWRTPRSSQVRVKSSWSSPFVWKHAQRTEIITAGHGAIISYDLNGKELWRINRVPTPSPSPVAWNGMLYVGIGTQGDSNRPMFAIKPGAAGDISLAQEATSNDYIQWFAARAAGYTPSPLVYEGRVFLVHDTGIMAVLDAQSGKEVYKVRVGGTGNTFSASPIGAAGRVYLVSEEGATFVLDARTAEYKELARNELGEMSLSSPAVAGNALFIRTQSKLYKIGK